MDSENTQLIKKPIDSSINPHLKISSPAGAVTSAIRLLVLNDIHRLTIEEATSTSNRTSVLAKSRVLVHKPVQRETSSRNVQAVYPVTLEARSLVAGGMLQSPNVASVSSGFAVNHLTSRNWIIGSNWWS